MTMNNTAEIIIDDDKYDLEFDNHVIFTYIDQWENHSIAKIQLSAEQARNDLRQLLNKQRQDYIDLLSQINKEIDTDLNTNTDLIKCTEQLNKLRNDLLNISSNIHLEHDKNKSSIYLIKLIIHQNKNQLQQIDKEMDEDYINVPGTELLSVSLLNKTSLSEQKQLLGERLFVLVQQIEPNLTAKITGMFMEWDIKYILMLIKSQKLIKAQIKKAIDILQVHQHRQNNVIKS